MSNVNHVRPDIVQKLREVLLHICVPIPVPGSGHVDHVKVDSRIGRVRFLLHVMIWQKRVLLPSENMDIVPFGQRLR